MSGCHWPWRKPCIIAYAAGCHLPIAATLPGWQQACTRTGRTIIINYDHWSLHHLPLTSLLPLAAMVYNQQDHHHWFWSRIIMASSSSIGPTPVLLHHQGANATLSSGNPLRLTTPIVKTRGYIAVAERVGTLCSIWVMAFDIKLFENACNTLKKKCVLFLCNWPYYNFWIVCLFTPPGWANYYFTRVKSTINLY